MRHLLARHLLPLACAAIAATAHAEPGALRALPLEPMPDAKARVASACASLPKPCHPETTTAYLNKPREGKLYLIDSDGPQFAIVEDAPGEARRIRQWDFSGYAHSASPVADGGDPPPLRIYPALYPLPQGRIAVAIVSEAREMYSGGGASFEIADFVELGSDPAPRRAVYASVPFSCSKMVRACFGLKEYDTSPHCHDEYSGYLTIRFPAQGNWQFTWHETDWPAHVRASKKTTTRTPFSVPGQPSKVPFCDGGPAS